MKKTIEITRYAQGQLKKAKESIYNNLVFVQNKSDSTKVLCVYKSLTDSELNVFKCVLKRCGYEI